ncbi:MAG: hypothetical protein WD766_07010 [Gemmatimonadota bacterium]
MIRVAKFLHSFVRQRVSGIEEREVPMTVADSSVPASYIRPRGNDRLPGWIVLHGITVPGREHPVLKRFAQALASTGAAVLIPEVPAWRRLELDPHVGDVTIASAVDYLTQRDDVAGPNLNLVGFSFGATQALMSATRPGVKESVRSVIGFGGYCDLRRTLHCMMTGEHEWRGVRQRLAPDPYGRWIVVGNYLQDVPEFSHMDELRRVAYELAVESGNRGVNAADPTYDPLKARLRARLPAEQRKLWDLIAPPHDITPPTDEAGELAGKLFEATIRRHPRLDPTDVLPEIDQKVVLVHGYDDRLIPYTETLRLLERLSPKCDVTSSITRLFAHSSEAGRLGALEYPRELARYVTLLQRALRPC